MGLTITSISTTLTIASGAGSTIRFIPVWLQSAQTLNGVIWFQAATGSYTANNTNAVGLYNYLQNGSASLVASSSNDPNIWSGSYSAGNTFVTKSFTSTYAASAGLYYIALLASTSAVTTNPTIGAGTNLVATNIGLRQLDFTNGTLSYGVRATVGSLPGSVAVGTYLNGLTQNIPYAAVY